LIHFLVAQKRYPDLQKNWNDTKNVLFEDLYSNDPIIVENAVYFFVSFGDSKVIPKLLEVLDNQKTSFIADIFLNCDNEILASSAHSWATRHGYSVLQIGNSSSTVWGGKK